MIKAFSYCRRLMVHRLCVASWLALLAQTSMAQASAQAPIRLVVPFTPGTSIDFIARRLGPHLAQRLGRAVVVENKPGASGNIGTESVVRAPADGATLLVTVSTLVMNRALYPKLNFDPLRDLDPVTLTSWGQLVLVTNTQTGIRSAQELIARARARPGALNYGSPGAGTPHHLAMEVVKNQADLSITHVPYRGTGPALTDLLGGQIDVMFLPVHVALQHIKAGRLIALASGSDTQNPLLPDVPTLRQLKLGDMVVDMWFGILAPKGTSKVLIDQYNTEFKSILDLPEIRTAFSTEGMTTAHSTTEEFRQLMVRDAARWAAIIKSQNIVAD
jgi:tripartite-type tricarboxylate transporter receptor subunit TctC